LIAESKLDLSRHFIFGSGPKIDVYKVSIPVVSIRICFFLMVFFSLFLKKKAGDPTRAKTKHERNQQHQSPGGFRAPEQQIYLYHLCVLNDENCKYK
jgi:hypothetical protein